MEHSVSRFRYDCAHARHQADAEQALREHVNAVEWRRLELTSGQDGSVWLKGILDAVGGAALRSALEPLARVRDSADIRCRNQRLADALVELAGHALDQGGLPNRNGQRPTHR